MTATERRYELNSLLKEILGSDNVYYQPPENLKLNFPCIIYELNGKEVRFADNDKYTSMRRYSVTIVDKNPDSEIPERLEQLPLTRFNRRYVADNIYHCTYSLYY